MPARAKLPPGEGKRVPLNMRTTRELRERLEKEAADSGRSLAQEVECRLEWSFSDPDARLQGLGSEGRLKLLRALLRAVDMVELTTGKDAFADPIAAESAYELLTEMLDAAFAVRPGGSAYTLVFNEREGVLYKLPAARRSVQDIRDALMDSVLPELPGAIAAFRKESKARRKGRR